jgi:uncharacterized protein YdeI (YjbR/CyaY-like superfamily)
MQPLFFETPTTFRQWLRRNHARAEGLLVGFYKRGSGKPSITWPESVDQALCFGWIDGVRNRIDDASYTIRFAPRKSGSTWSSVNIKRVQTLEQGLMHPAGLKAFEARSEKRSRIYSYEQRTAELEEPYKGLLKRQKAATSYFDRQPASYRRAVAWWIKSAKQEATCQRRFEKLLAVSMKGQRLPQFTREKPAR